MDDKREAFGSQMLEAVFEGVVEAVCGLVAGFFDAL
jgi:hypothetical protein